MGWNEAFSAVLPRLGQGAAGGVAAHPTEVSHPRAALVHAGVAVQVLAWTQQTSHKSEIDASCMRSPVRSNAWSQDKPEAIFFFD